MFSKLNANPDFGKFLCPLLNVCPTDYSFGVLPNTCLNIHLENNAMTFLGLLQCQVGVINTNNSEMCCKHCKKLQLLTKFLFFKHTCKFHFLGLAVPLHHTLVHSHYVVIGDTRLHLPTHTTFLFQRCWYKKMCACRGGGGGEAPSYCTCLQSQQSLGFMLCKSPRVVEEIEVTSDEHSSSPLVSNWIICCP